MDRAEYIERVMRRQQLPVRSPNARQRPLVYCPGLPDRPWHDTDSLDWISALEENADIVRRELMALRANPAGFQPYRQPEVFGPAHTVLHDQGDWNVFYFHFEQRRYEANCARCPETARLLDAIPRRTGLAAFSALAPGTHIAPHCGPFNITLRCHLGLVVPQGCSMRVGDEVREWQEGKCVLFDDTFEHEVWNRSAETRFVLMFDVYHPDLTDAEVETLRALWRTDEAHRLIEPWWDLIEKTRPVDP
jgi:aspartate beta-hydroxylase